jgi:PKD repeat protein
LPSGAATITAAASVLCGTAFTTDSVVLTLSQPIPAGTYQVNVQTGSDGNSMLDDCDNNVPDGSVDFVVRQNVSAQFAYTLKEGCVQDTLELSHDGANGTHTWNWQYDGGSATSQNASVIFNSAGDKNISLTVANDYCSDVSSQTVNIAPRVDAAFASPEVTCAVDAVTITDNSAGNITSWQWDFGNGTTSTVKNPDPFYFARQAGEQQYTITLNISNAIGCSDTASAKILVVGNCNILVPSGFTPNNDGKNDYLFPTNAGGGMVTSMGNRRVLVHTYGP